MCGIAGIYSLKSGIDPQSIKVMTDTLKHRGPDDEGFLAVNTKSREIFPLLSGGDSRGGSGIEDFNKSAHLLLGHRRLSILDLSSLGHQPMSNKDGTIWIVYNGEIYNYRELREELRKKGYKFKTNTDTEVLLSAYEEWGQDCLNKFNGMWAFVIYDARQNMLFGSRDRFGVKPLYYSMTCDFFTFSSEIKSIVKLPFIKKEINSSVIFDYLVLGWEEREDEGVFKNIMELQPSFAFSYDLSTNSFKKWKYYTLAYRNEWERLDEKKLGEYKEAIRDLIFQAVALRLRSDVPVGSCLSGGIDSSTIVCTINALLQKKSLQQVGDRQKVFTACYDGEAIDESHWARIVVEKTQTSWHQTFPKSHELLEDLEDLVYTQEIPFGSTSIYAQYRVMRLASEKGIKVLLDGQGGDELFAGYTPFYRAFFSEIIKNLDISTLIHELKGLKNSPVEVKFLINSLIELVGVKILPLFLKEFILRNTRGRSQYITQDFWKKNRERLKELGNKSTSLNQMLYEHIVNFNLKTLLRYEDRNSMRFSLEARTPFADDSKLIEYSFMIPSAYKIHNGWSKYILRQAMKGVIMEKIELRKDKIGFATPGYHWLRNHKDEIKTYIKSDLEEFLNVKEILNDWDTLIESPSRESIKSIWRYVNFAVWKKVYDL